MLINITDGSKKGRIGIEFALGEDAVPGSDALAGRFGGFHAALAVLLQQDLELAIPLLDLFVEDRLQFQPHRLQLPQLLLLQLLHPQLLLLLEPLPPSDLLQRLHLPQGVFDQLGLLVVAGLDEVGQVVPSF